MAQLGGRDDETSHSGIGNGSCCNHGPVGQRRNSRPARQSQHRPTAGAGRFDEAHQGREDEFEGKYQKVYNLLANDAKLRSKIKQTAAQYGIDPMHIVGAIVGEHTYNVDAYDRLQTYYVKAAAYLSNSLKFQYKDEDVSEFVQRPQFQACAGLNDSYDLWTCRETVWNENFRGKTVDGRLFPRESVQRGILPTALCRPDLRSWTVEPADGAADERHRQPRFGLRAAGRG